MTATVFGVGRATVSRNLRRHRETGDVLYKPKGGNNPRRVDLEWLRSECEARPDDRIADRIRAWEKRSGKEVSYGAMWGAIHAIGWSFKKKRR
jgi:transposase